jgi:putative inorganic carbon (HCO3(-)) transporter
LIESVKLRWVYGLCALFIALNCLFIANEFYWFAAVPAVLLIVMLALLALDKLMLFIVFCTPISINLQHLEGGLGLALPTEPLMFGIMLLFVIRLFYERKFDAGVMRHPVTITILINLVWIFITCLTSDLPVVSFKFLVSRLWFVICFYFIATQLFKDITNVRRFIWLYIIPLTLVIFYTIYEHSQYAFSQEAANWVMSPFYNDHTAYGVVLAMFYPVMIFFVFNKRLSISARIISFIFFAILTVALVLSYTRAAYVSLAGAGVLYFVYLFRIRFRTIIFALSALLVFFFSFRTDLLLTLEKNRQDSSTDFTKHLESVSNISSDASNLERINRWESALRMFRERPFFGWGPGTYSFRYAPYQLSSEKTIISTNAGDKGNAHSEYIGPLSESGVLGMITFLGIVGAVMYSGSRLYHRLIDKEMKNLVLAILLGLVTYFIHGGLNNFLDTDKASVPFWGFIAMLVTIDIYYSRGRVYPDLTGNGLNRSGLNGGLLKSNGKR